MSEQWSPATRPLLDLKWFQCRWPVVTSEEGQHFFCGKLRQQGSSYCPEHDARSLKRNERES